MVTAEMAATKVFLGTTTLQIPRAPRGFYRGPHGQPGPLPSRHLPFLCPKFPCPTRPCSRAAPSRAASTTTRVPPPPERVGRAPVVGIFRCSLRCSRAATGPVALRRWRAATFPPPLRAAGTRPLARGTAPPAGRFRWRQPPLWSAGRAPQKMSNRQACLWQAAVARMTARRKRRVPRTAPAFFARLTGSMNTGAKCPNPRRLVLDTPPRSGAKARAWSRGANFLAASHLPPESSHGSGTRTQKMRMFLSSQRS